MTTPGTPTSPRCWSRTPGLRTSCCWGDPRMAELVRRCAELADEFGVEGLAGRNWRRPGRHGAGTAVAAAAGSRDDYAGGRPGGDRSPPVIERGATIDGLGRGARRVFDAAENTVDWIIAVAGSAPVALVYADVVGPGSPIGVPVTLRHNVFRAAGTLDGSGRATLAILDADDRPAAACRVGHRLVERHGDGGARADEGPGGPRPCGGSARRRLADPHQTPSWPRSRAAESDY